jgi:pimeloyl-ACP methyl ester carboxylesterase
MRDRAMRLVDGWRIATHESGEGTPVLLLHGFGIDHRSLLLTFGPVFERRAGYRRLHVDLPGFGESPASPAIDSSDAMLEVVLALIDEVIGDERFLLVGQSWGGYLARGVVARRPAQVAGLALSIPVVIADHADREVPEHTILAEEPGVLDGVDPADADAFREMAVTVDSSAWMYFRDSILPAVAAADADALERIGDRYSFQADVDATGPPFEGPSLIVVGRQDSVVGYRDAFRRLLERYPRSTLAVLDSAGHNLEGERTALLLALVDDWLDRVERA